MDDNMEVETSQEPTTSNEIVSQWLQLFESGTFDPAVLNKHWIKWVPEVYSPTLDKSCLSWQFNEELAKEVLFAPIEKFICKEDPEEVLNGLKLQQNKATLCGRYFKHGEPTYSCRECGMDKTCVLCVECFKNSTHRFHKYRMGISGGGGCCDCGDVEAWKKDAFCTLHEAKPEDTEEDKEKLPADIAARTYELFNNILWYAYYRLTGDEINDSRNQMFREMSEDMFALDSYCTILYNDEVHTFDQVIQTLERVLKCNQRSSTEYVTSIDREGRSVVKCSSNQACVEMKREIEKHTSRHGNKPLRVKVTHAHIIAHQIFALKLLSWLEKFLTNGKGFRLIFSEVMLKKHEKKPNLLTEIMVNDSSLWKSARTQWHRLIIAGMLSEYENKKALAKVFTKNYTRIMQDFIRDDHEHSFSITSLSVQLYTVPTIAQHLIANDDVLYIILHTIISEYRVKCNKDGKLEFERNPGYHSLKRTLFMLYDLKYLLTFPPDAWTDDLKKSFLHGFAVMVNLLVMMQGMDSVTRQVGQHMEFEPEWESGFNLHIKLSYCLSHIIEWCATDKVVLVKSYRLLLRSLEENPCYDPNETEVRELADHSCTCLHYDVASKPVSIHLPLTRLLAALHLHLEKYDLNFDSPELQMARPNPVRIMEPVLRAQVMIAQVHSGMWRRNGYALLNTLFFYHNVKCRTEMLDRDVSLLQFAASLIESNEFLIHVLNRFNLMNWALPDFEINTLKSPEEDSMRQTISLVEEFLHLVIVIVGERHMPGVSNVTTKDRIKKDLLHALCIKPVPHSELIKSVSDDLEIEDGIVDDVIQEIAKFNEPLRSSNSKGTYELLPQFYDEFNVFFYHYTREEMSKAEEAQRKRRKQQGHIECCPPPQLPKLCESFSLLANLLQCDVMMLVMQTVLERCHNLRARSFSESQLHKVLHLIGYALQEEESGNYPFFKFVENASKFRIFELLEELLRSCPRVDAHKGLLQWTLNKYQQITKKELNNPEVLQKTDSVENTDLSEKERRAKLAAEKRAKIMAQMAAQQKSFLKENAKHFESSSMDFQSGQTSESSNEMEVGEIQIQPIALGPNQSARISVETTNRCILCQEEERITLSNRTMVLAAFIQQATVLHKATQDMPTDNFLFLNANLSPAPHASTCGHVMHSDCWRKFFDNVMIREHRRPYRLRHPSSFDVDKQEFLCPLCECLSNTVIPVLPSLSKLQPSEPVSHLSFQDYLLALKYLMTKKVKVCHGILKCDFDECTNNHCTACITSMGQDSMDECEMNCTLQPYQLFYSLPVDAFDPEISTFAAHFKESNIKLSPNLQEMVQVFTQVTLTRGFNVPPHPSDKRLLPMAWTSLAYTIHSIETVTSYQGKPLLGALSSRQRDSLSNLVKVVAVLGSANNKNELTKHYALNLLSILFDHVEEDASIVDFDPFSFLVALTFALPSLLVEECSSIPTGSTLEWHSLRFIFLVNIVRVLLGLQISEYIKSEEEPCDETLLRVLMAVNIKEPNVSTSKVWETVKEQSKPFLRCCVLFYHYLTEVPAPTCLQEVDGDTFENICAYLDLPTSPQELFDNGIVFDLIQLWVSHQEVRNYVEKVKNNTLTEMHGPPRLIELPDDYSELINSASTFVCPNNEEECRNPAMCLVCGKLLCSQSYCCQTEYNKMAVGACNSHAMTCGAGVGMYLRVRDCELLLLATPKRGCFMSAPYLDEHGETDQGLRRGNPLKLNRERYEKLQMMWLNHSIHEEIARQIETNSHIVSTQWNML
ncbi:E3 ubiquitin-protein ligase UBR2 isoform X2 [Anthonomus grandis grandis]|nr:E3 ubiquitin-protein ligase UBR2 isoform X2 [Anthonomus grandis grandis]